MASISEEYTPLEADASGTLETGTRLVGPRNTSRMVLLRHLLSYSIVGLFLSSVLLLALVDHLHITTLDVLQHKGTRGRIEGFGEQLSSYFSRPIAAPSEAPFTKALELPPDFSQYRDRFQTLTATGLHVEKGGRLIIVGDIHGMKEPLEYV